MPVLILYTFSLKHLSIKGKWFPKEPEKIKDAEESVEKILAHGEKQFSEIKAHYQLEYKKWQKLRSEIEELQEKKKQILSEEQ